MSLRYRRLAAAVAALTLSACGDGLGPGQEAFDPDQTTADFAAVDAAFATDAFVSLAALGGQFGVGAGAATSASADLLRAATDIRVSDLSLRLDAAARRLTAVMAANAAVELIPAQYRGLVLVYVPGEGYLPDTNQTGPADGIRFILYAVNPITKQIAEPLTEIGHVDLLDESTDITASVRLVVVSGGVTFVNYTVTASGPPTAPSVVIDGFITNGTTAVNFTLTHALQVNIGGSQVDIDYVIDVPGRDFQVNLDLTLVANDQGTATTIDLSVTHGSNTVRIEGSLDDELGTLQVFGNGQLFATVTITATGVEAVNAGGEPLTQREVQALGEIFDVVEEVFDVFENLFDPVEFLFNV